MASAQIITLSASGQADGSFTVSGVFWLTAPTNGVVPQPNARSNVSGISNSDLSALRAGSIVEQTFTSAVFGPGTSQATVDAALQALFTTAQNNLNNFNLALATVINRAFSGASWAAFTGKVPTLPQSNFAGHSIVTDLFMSAALGILPNVTFGRAAGYIATSAATTRIRATVYAPASPGVAAQRSLASSNAADAAAGTGARTVLVTYLTTAFVLKTEIVTLNGVTAVNMVATDLAYAESITVLTVGSGGSNAGTISLFNATAGGGGTLGSIAIGDNQTNWAHHYVPAGVTCYPLRISGGSQGTTALAGRFNLLHTGDPSQATVPPLQIGGSYPYVAGGFTSEPFDVPLAIPGPDLLVMTTTAIGATGTSYGQFQYVQL